jgi:hypothetical protein
MSPGAECIVEWKPRLEAWLVAWHSGLTTSIVGLAPTLLVARQLQREALAERCAS